MMTVDELMAIKSKKNKTINIKETVVIGDRDHLNLDGCEIISDADPGFIISGAHWSLQNGKIRTTNGVTIDIEGSTVGRVSSMFLESARPDKEIVRCIGNSYSYDTLFQACELASVPGMAVPMVKVSVDGSFYNSNTWDSIRFQSNGSPTAPAVLLECNIGGTWLFGNCFSHINGEQPNAGLIHCRTCSGTVIQNAVIYDAHRSNGVTDTLLYFGKTEAGLRCIHTTVRNYARLSGTLSSDKYDINLEQHYSTTGLLEQISAIGSSLRVRCPARTIRIGVQDFNDPWLNER